MKLQISLWLAVLLSGVDCLNSAVPYELLYFYSIYKMEFAAIGSSDRKIATGCAHGVNKSPAGLAFDAAAAAAGVEGICTFEEFVRHVGSKTTFSKFKFDAVGRAFNPDPDLVTQKLQVLMRHPTTNAKLKLLYWASHLNPKANFPTGTNAILEVPFTDILQNFANAAQTSRAAAATAGGSVQAFVQSWLNDAKIYLRMSQQFRIQDQTPFSLGHFRDSPQFQKFKDSEVLKTENIYKADGTTLVDSPTNPADTWGPQYQTMDWDATYNKAIEAGKATDGDRVAMVGVVEAYGTQSGTEAEITTKLHQDVIKMNGNTSNLLHGASTACQIVAKRRRRAGQLLSNGPKRQKIR